MKTTRYFICLANSYKRGGRCIAGIEVDDSRKIIRDENGNPRWLRPIAETPHGEIPNYIANNIKLLSLIKITGVEPCPISVHTENIRFSKLEVCHSPFPSEQLLLDRLIDIVHQSAFGSKGKAVSADVVSGLGYSLMFIHVENATPYIDTNREKSKNRMKFNYYGTEYDMPITDPVFLDAFRNNPERFFNIPSVYLTLSLGMEFEGWHHKLVAGVMIPTDSLLVVDSNYSNNYKTNNQVNYQHDWFDKYERELSDLLDKKAEIEEHIADLRKELMSQMEQNGIKKVSSKHFDIKYSPAKTIMQFDSVTFRRDNESLYRNYCIPKQREASIIVKRIKE